MIMNKEEILKNQDGTLNKNSVKSFESKRRILKELKKYECGPYELVKSKTVYGYIPRKKIIETPLTSNLIQVDIPAFQGTMFFQRRIYKSL